MLKNEKILEYMKDEIIKLLRERYFGKIIIELDIVDSNIAKKITINNKNYIVD